jgi:hypothetical protein
MTRRLLIVPILHTEDELGSEGRNYRDGFVAAHGEDRWRERNAALHGYWAAIRDSLSNLPIPYAHVKVYQDSLPNGEHIDRLIDDMAADGSPNHAILQLLRSYGATIVGTEALHLLLEEYMAIKDDRATPDFLRHSLEMRDQYIARRIDETLSEGEIGILFVGAAHDVARHCDPGIDIGVFSPEYT